MLMESKSTGATAPATVPAVERPEAVFGLPPMREPWIGFLDVSPSAAGRLLPFNTANRPISEPVRAEYEALIRSGRFEPTNQGIGFDAAGVLVDGQKRLAAISASGRTVRLAVAFGLPPGAFKAVDRGERRLLAHYLIASGFIARPNTAKTLETAARVLFHYDAGRLPWELTPVCQPDDVDRVLSAHPGLVDAATDCNHRRGNPPFPPGPTAAFLALFREVDEAMADLFLEGLRTGVGLEEGEPLLALRKTLNSGNRQQKDDRADYMGRLVRAWNATRSGQKLSTLRKGTPDGRFPVVDGAPPAGPGDGPGF